MVHKTIKIVKWEKPPLQVHKVNTDGSCREGECGAGGVIRDSEVKIIVAFSIFLGRGTSNWAESKALQFGLDLAEVEDLQQVIAEVDSKFLMTCIKGETTTPWNMLAEVGAIKKEVQRRRIRVQHCYREANRAADKLASISHDHRESMLYSTMRASHN